MLIIAIEEGFVVWQSVAAAVLLGFGIIVAVVGVVVYLRMYRKQKNNEPRSHDSESEH